MFETNALNDILNNIDKSIKRTLEQIKDNRVETEPSITDRFSNNIERDFDQIEGIKVNIRTLKDKGPNAAENKYGADVAVIINIDLNNYKVQKGYLAQAKWNKDINIKRSFVNECLCNRKINFISDFNLYYKNNSEFIRLKDQCNDMLRITSDSFVYIYSDKGIFVSPASAVAGSSGNNYIISKHFISFFYNFITSFIGDIKLKSTSDDQLEDLRIKLNSRSLLFISFKNNE